MGLPHEDDNQIQESQIEPVLKVRPEKKVVKLNAELNKLFDEKNELLKKIESSKDFDILDRIRGISVKLEDIDKNKGAFYSKIGNKKPLEEILKPKFYVNQDSKSKSSNEVNMEPQICSSHLSNSNENAKINKGQKAERR